MTTEARAPLQERRERRKAEVDAHRRGVRFAVGDEALLDSEHTPTPTLALSLVRGSSQFGPARSGPMAAVP